MTKGELIVACIKLMFDNDVEQLDATTISDITEYHSRTMNIVEVINRGFDEVAKARKLPRKTTTINVGDGDIGEYYTRFTLPNDFFYVSNIAYESELNYDNNVEIKLEGENILVLPTINEGKYIITYFPKCTSQLSYNDPDTKEIVGIPDEDLRVIPYFVKAELFEDDDPSRATLSRNVFHQYLAEIPKTPILKQTRVKSVFRGL